MKGHYTCNEAVEIFEVTLKTGHNWIRNGRLRAVKIGSRWYIPKAAVSDLMENGETKEERR